MCVYVCLYMQVGFKLLQRLCVMLDPILICNLLIPKVVYLER